LFLKSTIQKKLFKDKVVSMVVIYRINEKFRLKLSTNHKITSDHVDIVVQFILKYHEEITWSPVCEHKEGEDVQGIHY